MTLNQLQILTEDELGLALYVVNHISPAGVPPPPYEPVHLTWWKHKALIQSLLDAFPHLKPEGHAIYSSLMAKLGVTVEIKPVTETPPTPPQPAETSSIFNPSTELEKKPDMPEMFKQMPTGSV